MSDDHGAINNRPTACYVHVYRAGVYSNFFSPLFSSISIVSDIQNMLQLYKQVEIPRAVVNVYNNTQSDNRRMGTSVKMNKVVVITT